MQTFGRRAPITWRTSRRQHPAGAALSGLNFRRTPSAARYESDDAAFYVEPRSTTHIDDAAIAALTAFYRVLPPGGGC